MSLIDGKGFFGSGTVLANLLTFFAGADQIVALVQQVPAIISPVVSATVVAAGSLVAIWRRVAAKKQITKVL